MPEGQIQSLITDLTHGEEIVQTLRDILAWVENDERTDRCPVISMQIIHTAASIAAYESTI